MLTTSDRELGPGSSADGATSAFYARAEQRRTPHASAAEAGVLALESRLLLGGAHEADVRLEGVAPRIRAASSAAGNAVQAPSLLQLEASFGHALGAQSKDTLEESMGTLPVTKEGMGGFCCRHTRGQR